MEFIEAMQTAIKYERQVRDAYHESMKKTKNPDMIDLLRSLSERRHVTAIGEIVARLQAKHSRV